MKKTVKTENTASRAYARARTDSDQLGWTADQFSCKYFFCQIKIEPQM
jgi:hypothetical protein